MRCGGVVTGVWCGRGRVPGAMRCVLLGCMLVRCELTGHQQGGVDARWRPTGAHRLLRRHLDPATDPRRHQHQQDGQAGKPLQQAVVAERTRHAGSVSGTAQGPRCPQPLRDRMSHPRLGFGVALADLSVDPAEQLASAPAPAEHPPRSPRASQRSAPAASCAVDNGARPGVGRDGLPRATPGAARWRSAANERPQDTTAPCRSQARPASAPAARNASR